MKCWVVHPSKGQVSVRLKSCIWIKSTVLSSSILMKPTGFTANYMFILSWDSLIHLQSHLRLSCAGNYKEENTEKIANRVYSNVHSEDLNKTLTS